MRSRVPASSANLGPGFDTLAVALTMYVEVDVQESDDLKISSSGLGAGKFDNEGNLAVQIVREVLGHSNFSIHIHSDIPLARGLGSSAALAIAAAQAAGSKNALAIGTKVDGHAENAAASLLGGLISAGVTPQGEIVARQLPLDPIWQFVVVIPEMELATSEARKVLPQNVSHHDAVMNVNSLGLLLPGLAHHELFIPSSMDDYLHQPFRMPLIPFAKDLLELLRNAGAAGSCWSGAGSTMLGLATKDNAVSVAEAAQEFLKERGIDGNVRTLDADTTGASIV